ncbi:hypothetical protein V1514DRAFT_324400 [Lipomyces japonicus]|uniref:uncharacterized protein n=1 Tax=Lipomyces japonicus TaxID=56871 RepID=UPI0034CFB784
MSNFTIPDADLTVQPRRFRRKPLGSAPKRIKNARQVAADDFKRTSSSPSFHDRPTFASVEAPPSVAPRKWWCDVTGLPAPYRMPASGLRYYNAEVFRAVKTFPPGVDQRYLSLRSANVVLK